MWAITIGKKQGRILQGVLGMRRTPCETEHDVTISRSYDEGKITKKYKDNHVRSIPKVCATYMYVLDCSRIRRAFAVVSCAVPGLKG